MISSQARPYIDASVPVLREHGLAITTTFYRNMFKAHPELTNLFNMGNQASGVQQQSLAAAVFAYAANIDNVAALAPVVKRIVHKHASVGITAEHYPIVGHYLLGAIQETLGDAATPPLLAAWEEAYSSLANVLISAEKELYAEAGITAGELRDMRVVAIQKESEDIATFTLEPADGKLVPDFKPGQYLSVSITLAAGHRQLRQYSLADKPNQSTLKISVKRQAADSHSPAGQISNWIHSHIKVGSILQTTHPFGEFSPDTESNEPIVLLSAGVGITPMISVLKRIAEINPSRFVIFGHATRNPMHHAHQQDVKAAKKMMTNLQTVTFYEEISNVVDTDNVIFKGHMLVDNLPKWSTLDTNIYLCGPLPFMQEQWQALIKAGVPAFRLHREIFGPDMLDTLI